MQQLEVSLTIPIPSDSVLISKIQFEDLKKQELLGVYWNMKDLEKRTSKKQDWIKENILYPSKFRKILDVESGGFVYYPKASGQPWSFLASEMAKFLNENFYLIFGRT